MMMNLSDLFPDEDYRFHMALRRGTVAEFFGRTAASASVLAERQRWLRREPKTYSACLPEGAPLLDECIAFTHDIGALSDEQHVPLLALTDANERCAALGQNWEPDFLLLKSDAGAPHRLLAGCVCFPSSWNFGEKIGQTLEIIHGVVPSLNAQLGSSIHSFLSKLTPGVTWLRHNWGLSRSPELNQHPQRHLRRLDGAVELSDVWLRIEHQALVALPRSGCILFGIRIAMHSLAEVKMDAAATPKLVRALRTMPAEVAAYKGLAVARDRIIELLR
jgi:hypothetical protein